MFDLTARTIISYLDRVMHSPKPKAMNLLNLMPNKETDDTAWVKELRATRDNLLLYPADLGCPIETQAYTVERFTLWAHNKTGSPIAIRGGLHYRDRYDQLVSLGIPRCKVQGNLLRLKDKALDDLDSVMQNGVNFIRKRVNIIIPILNWEGFPTKVDAWMYVGMQHLRENIVWDNTFHHRTGGLEFSLAQRLEDSRRWISKFYKFQDTHLNGKDIHKCFTYIHRGLNDPAPAPKPELPVTRIVVEQATPHK